MINHQSFLYFASNAIFLWAVTYKNVICLDDEADFNTSDNTQTEDFQNPSKQKIILFGTIVWKDNPYPFLDETKKMCPQCIFTTDEDLWKISDVVLFHAKMMPKIPQRHPRPKGQIWVWLNFESPQSHRSYEKAENYEDMFNWTMTYRHDSDVVVPYGRFVSVDKIPRPKYDEVWAFKSSGNPDENGVNDASFMSIPSVKDIKSRKMAAWIASQCNRPSKRDLLVKKLQKYIQVDIYGKCGNFTCDAPRSEWTKVNCQHQISKKYKFYLAFENSLCEDYVTEKYFDALQTQMIPVVYGDANYSKLAPKNSYINVFDFKSTEELANYLKYLDSNPNEFLKYFEWRKHYWVQNNRYVTGYCDLCKKLWSYDQNTPNMYHSIAEWWLRRSNFQSVGLNACRRPDSTYLYKAALK